MQNQNIEIGDLVRVVAGLADVGDEFVVGAVSACGRFAGESNADWHYNVECLEVMHGAGEPTLDDELIKEVMDDEENLDRLKKRLHELAKWYFCGDITESKYLLNVREIMYVHEFDG